MGPRILLVNPPIYDFSAYDFWLKPYGLLRVAGYLRGQAELRLFDYLDRLHPTLEVASDSWGRGPFPSENVPRPEVFATFPRQYRRYGLPGSLFQSFLDAHGPFDLALVQTVMTYWYPGVREVIADIRSFSPGTKIALGGVYATLCPDHARSLGADLVVEGSQLEPLWRWIGLSPRLGEVPAWEAYSRLDVGILKLAVGCPFRCTYCSVPKVDPAFIVGSTEKALDEFDHLCRLGVQNVAFYDDALLYRPEAVLLPFLRGVRSRRRNVAFHTPNALNARFLSRELAEEMIASGFRTFFLGFESSAYEWQHRTGGKVYSEELERSVQCLTRAGADPRNITAYIIIAHPAGETQQVEASMQFAHSLGIRVMLSEFSPIPGTPDGERCRQWVDLVEPLWHNKTVFAARLLGDKTVNGLKSLSRTLNRGLPSTESRPRFATTP
jgi:hypothetical protein